MIFIYVLVAEWPPFGKGLHILSTLCSLCYVYLYAALTVSHFCFEGKTLVMIASVPGHCLPFTFYNNVPVRVSVI